MLFRVSVLFLWMMRRVLGSCGCRAQRSIITSYELCLIPATEGYFSTISFRIEGPMDQLYYLRFKDYTNSRDIEANKCSTQAIIFNGYNRSTNACAPYSMFMLTPPAPLASEP
jgi:hypothetical protein